MQEKFIQLSEEEKIILQEGMKNGKSHLFRERRHCLLLSSNGYEVKHLAEVFRVGKTTSVGVRQRTSSPLASGAR